LGKKKIFIDILYCKKPQLICNTINFSVQPNLEWVFPVTRRSSQGTDPKGGGQGSHTTPPKKKKTPENRKKEKHEMRKKKRRGGEGGRKGKRNEGKEEGRG